jgi:hypothetical protein
MGYIFGAITVCYSKGLIIDGNHRFIAYSLAGIQPDIKEGTSNHSDVLKSYNDLRIGEVADWDMNDVKKKIFCNDDF